MKTYSYYLNRFKKFLSEVSYTVLENNYIEVTYKGTKITLEKSNRTKFISVKKLGNVKLENLFYISNNDDISIEFKNNEFLFFCCNLDERKITSYITNIKSSIDIDGNLSKEFKGLPININDWTEEDYFYFKMKYC